eukprot:11184032-Lingulodinium_polyedra.AAC.1
MLRTRPRALGAFSAPTRAVATRKRRAESVTSTVRVANLMLQAVASSLAGVFDKYTFPVKGHNRKGFGECASVLVFV